MTMQTEDYMQTEAFPKPPKTRRELAEEFLEHFQADVEAAEKSLINARVKLRNAVVLRDDAEENLRRALHGDPVEGEAEIDSDEGTRLLEAPAEDAEWSDAIDPITGEVASRDEREVPHLGEEHAA